MKQFKDHMPVEKDINKLMNDAGKSTKNARINRRHDNMIKAVKSRVSKEVC